MEVSLSERTALSTLCALCIEFSLCPNGVQCSYNSSPLMLVVGNKLTSCDSASRRSKSIYRLESLRTNIFARDTQHIMQSRLEFLDGLTPLTEIPEGIDNECSICTDEFDNPIQLSCKGKHVFCKSCINEWLSLKAKNSCPNCREALFAINATDRGPVGAERVQVVALALQSSHLLDNNYVQYGGNIEYSVSEVQRATAAANQYIAEQHHPPIVGAAYVDARFLGPHILVMGNLVHGYAQAMGRGYNATQRRDWKTILDRLYALIFATTNPVPRIDLTAQQMVMKFKANLLNCLIGDGVDVISGMFFQRDARVESAAGDLDFLIEYVLFQANQLHERREREQEAQRQAQRQALGRETNRVSRAVRWVGQALFNVV